MVEWLTLYDRPMLTKASPASRNVITGGWLAA